ncbi:MAG TPA: GNAT family N-acetyltransferase [Gammaproteobacteria bacterium]|nr:GNAT family N-acetyltransferase [Gammaproteobacteria bacterium]HRA43231.1 GNAT family N-acetyltransferase [Gammaproteobacteria bacterium]
MQFKNLKTYDDIAKSFETFLELRPTLSDVQSFTQQILNQQKDGYEIIAIIEDEEVMACIGFRMMTMLAWGKILYIDDLITKEKWQRRGYGKILLEHITKIAKDNQCNQVHLDTGYTRYNAHRIYLNQGFEFHCHHLALKLK